VESFSLRRKKHEESAISLGSGPVIGLNKLSGTHRNDFKSARSGGRLRLLGFLGIQEQFSATGKETL
jgi:hypothetical protein